MFLMNIKRILFLHLDQFPATALPASGSTGINLSISSFLGKSSTPMMFRLQNYAFLLVSRNLGCLINNI